MSGVVSMTWTMLQAKFVSLFVFADEFVNIKHKFILLAVVATATAVTAAAAKSATVAMTVIIYCRRLNSRSFTSFYCTVN